MSKQTVRYAKSRLARMETFRVYSYEITTTHRAFKRVGVYKIGA